MINKIQNIIGNYGKVKEINDVYDITISKSYYIEFYSEFDGRFDYKEYWRLEIKKGLPNVKFELYYHQGNLSATLCIKKSLREERKLKLEKLNEKL